MTLTDRLIVIPKTQYILQNVINVGTGSCKTKFRCRANSYKSTHLKFKNEKQVPKEELKQKHFHEHFCSDDHNGIQD